MNDFFKIEGFDIKHIKETNELVGTRKIQKKTKKSKAASGVFILVFLSFLSLSFLFVYKKLSHIHIKESFEDIIMTLLKEETKSITEQEPAPKTVIAEIKQQATVERQILLNPKQIESNGIKKTASVPKENRVEPKEKRTVAETKKVAKSEPSNNVNDIKETKEEPKGTPKPIEEKKAEQKENPQFVSGNKDYTIYKPWEALNIIQGEPNVNDEKSAIDALFKYFCTFETTSSAQNQSLASVWQVQKGSIKNVSELFSYVINASGNDFKCYTVKRGDNYWNEIEINGKSFYYDISHKKVSTNNNSYTDGFRY